MSTRTMSLVLCGLIVTVIGGGIFVVALSNREAIVVPPSRAAHEIPIVIESVSQQNQEPATAPEVKKKYALVDLPDLDDLIPEQNQEFRSLAKKLDTIQWTTEFLIKRQLSPIAEEYNRIEEQALVSLGRYEGDVFRLAGNLYVTGVSGSGIISAQRHCCVQTYWNGYEFNGGFPEFHLINTDPKIDLATVGPAAPLHDLAVYIIHIDVLFHFGAAIGAQSPLLTPERWAATFSNLGIIQKPTQCYGIIVPLEDAVPPAANVIKAAAVRFGILTIGNNQPIDQRSSDTGKTVHVRGYTRKNGTPVKAYSRSAPGLGRSSRGSRGGRR